MPTKPLIWLNEFAYTQCISLESTLQGSQGSWSASVNSNEDPRGNIIAEADTNRNLRQGGMSTNSLLDHGRQYTEIRTTPDFSAPSTLPDNYTPPIVVPYQERASTEIPEQSQNLGNGPTAASSSLPLKPIEDRYRCSICGLDFSQKRGVTRHHRDVHEVSLCLHCSGFEWHRRHQLKDHLEEQHPDVHVPAALAEATRYRRRATMSKSRLQGKHYYRWSWNEQLPQSLTPPLLPVIEIAHVSSPAVSCVAYDAQPEPTTMPTTTNLTRRRKYSRKLALFDAIYAHVSFFFHRSACPTTKLCGRSFLD